MKQTVKQFCKEEIETLEILHRFFKKNEDFCNIANEKLNFTHKRENLRTKTEI